MRGTTRRESTAEEGRPKGHSQARSKLRSPEQLTCSGHAARCSGPLSSLTSVQHCSPNRDEPHPVDEQVKRQRLEVTCLGPPAREARIPTDFCVHPEVLTLLIHPITLGLNRPRLEPRGCASPGSADILYPQM